MRLSGIFALTIFISFPLFAGMTAEEICEKRGEVSKQASNLRISGMDKDAAIDTLSKKYDHPDTVITANNVRGLVTVAYLAKMKPEQMRDYTIDQCKKDILK